MYHILDAAARSLASYHILGTPPTPDVSLSICNPGQTAASNIRHTAASSASTKHTALRMPGAAGFERGRRRRSRCPERPAAAPTTKLAGTVFVSTHPDRVHPGDGLTGGAAKTGGLLTTPGLVIPERLGATRTVRSGAYPACREQLHRADGLLSGRRPRSRCAGGT
eukprot:gene14000-biopygen10015